MTSERDPEQFIKRRFWKILPVFMLIVAIPAFIFGLHEFDKDHTQRTILKERGVLVAAETSPARRGLDDHRFHYAFTARNGQKVTGSSMILDEDESNGRPDSLDVIYDPLNPESHLIHSEFEDHRYGFSVFFHLFLLPAFISFAAGAC